MQGEERSHLEQLIASRPAFDESSEAKEVDAIVANLLPQGNVSWLEVGAGDGRNLRRLMKSLSLGRTLEVVALEPAPIDPLPPDIDWLRMRAEEYKPDRTFSWINVRHSLYYLLDPVGQIARLASALADGGVLALTHWSRNCILRRLHAEICGRSTGIACDGIEELAAELATMRSLAVSPVRLFNSRFATDRISDDPHLAAAIYDLARRDREPLAGGGPENVAQLLTRLDRPETRINGLLLVRRKPG